MYPYYFMGDMYSDAMPLGLSSAIIRGLAAYEYFTAIGEPELARQSLIPDAPAPDGVHRDDPDSNGKQALM